MIDLILKGWNAGLHMYETIPAGLAAFLVGWFFSIGVTQTLKFRFPAGAPGGLRESWTRWIAFFSAVLPALGVALERDLSAFWTVLVPLCTGVWSPLAFALVLAALRARGWTWAADVLSADTRGVLSASIKKALDKTRS